MSHPLASVANRLFDLVIDLDPARAKWERLRENLAERARALVQEIDAQLAASGHQTLEASADRAKNALLRAKANLHELAESMNSGVNGTKWRTLYAKLAKDYEELTRALRASNMFEGINFRRLAPVNYVRNGFHVLGGVTGALAYHYLLDRTGAVLVMTVFVVVFTTLEILRRRSEAMNDLLMRFPFFKRIARAHEYYKVNSATYYAWGMLVAVVLAPRQAVEAACLVLAFGDPVASNLGRRYGRVKLFHDKSVVGTLAFLCTAFLVLFAYQLLFYAVQPIGVNVLVAFAGAAIGATAEALTVRFDDNLTVPLSTALGLALLLAMIGLA